MGFAGIAVGAWAMSGLRDDRFGADGCLRGRGSRLLHVCWLGGNCCRLLNRGTARFSLIAVEGFVFSSQRMGLVGILWLFACEAVLVPMFLSTWW